MGYFQPQEKKNPMSSAWAVKMKVSLQNLVRITDAK
jgi:hypothetical protein